MSKYAALQPAFTGGVLDPALHARRDFDKTAIGLKRADNCFIHAQGGVSNRPGLEFVAQVKTKGCRLIPFNFGLGQTYVLEFGPEYMRVIKEGGLVLDGDNNIYELNTPYSLNDLSNINYAQSNDVMKLAHPGYAVRDLKRLGHANWTLNQVTFKPAIEPPTGVSASGNGSGTSYSYVVTAETDTGEESVASSVATCQRDNLSSSNPNGISWSVRAGAVRYNVYKLKSGLYGWIGASETTNFSDANIDADTSDTPPKERTPFNGPNKYPAVVDYHQQRAVYAGWNDKPNGFEMSVTGAFNNLSIASPAKADDAISQAIAHKEMQRIHSFVPLKSLLCLTTSGVWEIVMPDAGNNSSPVLNVKIQSYFGASAHRPLIVGNNGLYIGTDGQSIYDVRFDALADSYNGEDITILARHLFEGRKIKEWAYAQSPYSLVYVVMEDGGLLVLTYLKEHKIKAWTTWQTQGKFKSVAVVPEGGESVAYFIVEREVGGQSVEYIERLHSRFFQDATGADGFFVDSGLSYSGIAKSEFSGLDHLEGRAVVALADGVVVENLSVTDGKITLPRAAAKVQIGLAYSSTIETIPWFSEQIPDAGFTKQVVISKASLSLLKSRGLKIGGYELKYKQAAWGAPDLLMGVEEMPIAKSGYEKRPTVTITQELPLPLTILAVAIEVSYGQG